MAKRLIMKGRLYDTKKAKPADTFTLPGGLPVINIVRHMFAWQSAIKPGQPQLEVGGA